MNQADRAVPGIKLTPVTTEEKGWLNRNVIGMGITSLLSDWGHEMATAILPASWRLSASPPQPWVPSREWPTPSPAS